MCIEAPWQNVRKYIILNHKITQNRIFLGRAEKALFCLNSENIIYYIRVSWQIRNHKSICYDFAITVFNTYVPAVRDYDKFLSEQLFYFSSKKPMVDAL